MPRHYAIRPSDWRAYLPEGMAISGAMNHEGHVPNQIERLKTHIKAFTVAANAPYAYKMMFIAVVAIADVGRIFMTFPEFRAAIAARTP